MVELIHLCLFLGVTLFKGTVSVDPPYNVPTCTPSYRTLNISESTAAGTVLLSTLSCTDADTGQEGTLKYRLTKGSIVDFGLDETTGEIKLNNMLNADANMYYLLEIEVYDQGTPSLTSTVVVDLIVHSVNDNAPEFVGLSRNIFVSDGAPVGIKVTSCTLVDKDYPRGGLAGEVRFIKTGGDRYNKFVVDPMKCDIYLRKKLYYEKKNRFDLTLVAYDLDPVSPRSTTQVLTVYVRDANSYSPYCAEYMKLAYVPESTSVGSKISQLSCNDKDTGSAGRLHYYAVSGNRDVLRVSSSTGAVYLDSALDFESGLRELSLQIRVRDSPFGQKFSVTAEVRVTVTNTDDEDLKWTSASVFTTTIPEDIPTGTVILTPQAEDLDTVRDRTNFFIYGFAVPPSHPWFSIDPGTGAIVVTSPPDRDTLPLATFDINAYSNNAPSIRIVASVTVTITDINDEEPKFTKSIYTAILQEHTGAGSTVTTVSSDDPDEGLGGEVEYSIDGTFFDIDPTSGVVTIASKLDQADGLSHSARVTARDKGVPSFSSESMVMLTVTPVNDHAPAFDLVLDTTIDEYTRPGTSVLQVAATDLDLGHDGEVIFSLQDPSVPFFIDPNSGEVFTRSGMDRETDETWAIVVVATDKAKTSPKSSSITVHFDIADVNDNVPVCDPVPTATLPKPYTTGSTLSTLNCSDKDINQNRQLFYDIIAGDTDGVFSMSAGGNLILTKSPTAGSYALILRVKDGGATPLSTVLPVQVIVEVGLNFTNLPTTVNKDEDIKPGDPVIEVETCCAFNTLIYEIISGNDDARFIIDPGSGQVYMLGFIDRESVNTYTIGVRAKTIGGSETVDSYFDLIVGDVNDNDPVFGSSFTNISVVESWAINTGIRTITATDRDTGNNAVLTYSITSGNADNVFSIDSAGLLTLDKPLDAETLSFYTLILSVTDGGTTSRSGETTVFVEVLNVDEHSPEIIGVTGIIDTATKEDAALGSQLFKLEARDLDVTSKLTYKITGGNDGHFLLNAEFIYLVKYLDRETKDIHVLNLEVSNELNEKVTADLRITVDDVNDNDPAFNRSVYSFKLNDGTGSGLTVGTLSVTDDDTGVNSEYDLTITNGNTDELFEIVGSSIQTKSLVSYSLNEMYTLTIKAEDRGSPSRSSFTAVVISIIPGLPTPGFSPKTLSISMDENTVASSSIIDLDATKNGAKETDLTYSIRNGNTNNAFSIQASSGKVFIARNLDFEDVELYTLTIDAARKDTPSSTDSLILEIRIRNLNDNSPVFTKLTFQFPTTEGASAGTTVGRVVVSDTDKGVFGDVSLSMLPSAGSTDFDLDPATGYLTVATLPEYSRQRTYYISVVGSDGGSPALSASAVVVVEVVDTNNHNPEFSATEYSFAIVETVAKNDEIYTIRATDSDSGPNADITYEIISGNTDSNFKIDTNTGAIAVANELDRETKENYMLGIRSTDSGASPRTGECTINITLIDVNDNTPQFSVPSVIKTVNRFAASGTIISSETATDTDAGKNGDVVYVITSGNEDGIFLIGRANGVLTMVSAPTVDLYTLIVTASDGGSPVKTAQLTVTVRVTPVVQPVVSEFSFSILENSAVNTPVGDVLPHPSHRLGAVITYSITSGNFDSLFSVTRLGNGNGGINVAKGPDREDYEQYVIIVKELDNDGLSIDRVVKITILDENDNSPIFSPASITLKVVENTPVGHEVKTLAATDPDDSVNGQITYTISPADITGKELFQIDNSGKLSIKRPPDFEDIRSFSFDVIGTDGGGEAGLIKVNVDIIDVAETIVEADAAGVSAFITLEVPDIATNGAVVTTLTVEDFGLKSADVTSVRFLTVESDGIFSVNEGSGVVTVQNANQLIGGSRYFTSVVCRVVDSTSGEIISVLGLIRIDGFSAVKYMIVMTFSNTKDYISLNRMAILAHVQTFFLPSHKVVIWEVRGEGSSSRRRLLAAQSSAHIYVLANPSSNTLNTIQDPKVFLPQQSALQNLQLSADGTPVAGLSTAIYPVDKVMPYDVGVTSSAAVFAASPEGMATIALAAAAALVLIIILVACIVYRCKKKKQKFLDISETGEKKKRATTAPRFKHIPPVAPSTTVIPQKYSSIVTTPFSKTPAPVYNDIVKDTKRPKPIVRVCKTTPSKFPSKNKPVKGNPALVSSTEDEEGKKDNISDVGDGDDTSCDTGYNDDTSPSPQPMKPVFKEEPLLVGGKVYDGVGFEGGTNTPYVYNTKTGEVSHDVDNNDIRLTRDSMDSTPTSTIRHSTPLLQKSQSPPHTSTSSDIAQQITQLFVSRPNGERRGSLPDDLSPKKTKIKQYTTPNYGKVASRYLMHFKGPSKSESLQDIRTFPRKPRSGLSGSIDSGISQLNDDTGSSFSDSLNSLPTNPGHRQLTHKLNWTGVSTIPHGMANRRDIMSRDPVYYDWARSIARKGKRPLPSDKTVIPGDVTSYITKTATALPPHMTRQRFGWMNNNDA